MMDVDILRIEKVLCERYLLQPIIFLTYYLTTERFSFCGTVVNNQGATIHWSLLCMTVMERACDIQTH